MMFMSHVSCLCHGYPTTGGCELKCSVLNEDKQLVTASQKAVYFFEPDERGICYGFEGHKKMVAWCGQVRKIHAVMKHVIRYLDMPLMSFHKTYDMIDA